MLTYSADAALYPAWVGLSGGIVGMLRWPAVAVHLILTTLLIRSLAGRRPGADHAVAEPA